MKKNYKKPVGEITVLDLECRLLSNSGPQSGDADSQGLFFDESGNEEFVDPWKNDPYNLWGK